MYTLNFAGCDSGEINENQTQTKSSNNEESKTTSTEITLHPT